MSKLDTEEYIKSRLDDQISWYDNRSIDAQKKFKRCQAVEIIAAALIPLLSGYVTSCKWIPVIISLLGTLIVVLASISRLGKYHENWLQYRETCELLRHEKYLFITGTKPYEDQNFQLLVERVESIISAENINWSQLASADEKK